MPWFDDCSDEEFEQRTVSLDKVLFSHLGSPPNREDALTAEFVMMPIWLPGDGLGAMNARAEKRKLVKIQRLADELAATWASLHSDTRSKMEIISSMIHETEGKHAKYHSHHPLSLDLISILDGLVNLTAPLANDVIEAAPDAGRRDLLSVAIVERLRQVWEERKSVPAPKSMNETGPFASFIVDSFEILGLENNPRAAVDSWCEFRARYPIGA